MVYPLALTLALSSARAGAQLPTAREPFLVLTGQSLAELIARLKPAGREDLVGRDGGSETLMYVQHERDQMGEAELHRAADDYHFVVDGSATYWLGGRIEAPREIRPGEWRSQSLSGARAFEVRKGDLVVVPRGTPHQRSSAGRDLALLLVKVYADPTPLKATPPGGDVSSALVGSWRLVDSYDVRAASGAVVRSRGARPLGTLVYQADGRMSVQVMNDGRPAFTRPRGTPSEVAAAFEGYTAYFGRFEVRAADSAVIHHIEGSLLPDEVGASRTRYYSLQGDRLSLRTAPFEVDGEQRLRTILWERVR
jgi:mannose-6-phosphate isomerase-like protein (cupin superfamily)